MNYFSIYKKKGVDAARKLVTDGLFFKKAQIITR